MLKRTALALVGLCLAACSAAPAFATTESGHRADYTAATAAHTSDIEAGAQRDARVDAYANPEVSPMSVRAKVICSSKALCAHHKADGTTVEAAQVTFGAVFKPTYDADDPRKQVPGNAVSENAIFGEYSPNVHLTMYITNPDAHRQFVQGQHYYVDFTEAPAT